MSLILSSRDLASLRDTFRVLLSPLQYGDKESWARAASQAVCEVTEVDSVLTAIYADSSPTFVTHGQVSRDEMLTYAASWHHQTVSDRERLKRGLLTWVREDVWPAVELRRSTYYNDFCIPVKHRDSAGMSVYENGRDAMVVFISSHRASQFVPAGREAMLLQLLQPALVNGVHLWGGVRAPAVLLNTVDAPIAAYDQRGRMIYATQSFEAIRAEPIYRAQMTDAARALAREAMRCLPRRQRERSGLNAPPCRWRSADGGLLLEATLYEHEEPGIGPLCTITAHRVASASDVSPLHARFGLTRRETDVAALIAKGWPNRRIAQTLSISEHTVRRHTEQVLRKVGVRSRAEVAAVFARSAASTLEA